MFARAEEEGSPGDREESSLLDLRRGCYQSITAVHVVAEDQIGPAYKQLYVFYERRAKVAAAEDSMASNDGGWGDIWTMTEDSNPNGR
jgi:cytochrome c551/c552